MHTNMSQEPLCTEIYRRNAASPPPRRRLFTSLCSRNAFQHFKRATLYRNLHENAAPRIEPRTQHTLCASLRSRNAHQYVTRAALYGNLQEKCCTPTTAVQTFFEPVQSKCVSTFKKSQFLQKFTGKMPRPGLSPERRHIHFVRACAVEMQVNEHFRRTILYGNLQEKCCASKPRLRLCASLHSRNAFQHFTRATLYRNLQEK